MKVNIYYGGRGLIEDSTIYVMDKLTEVLEEIRVEVVRYNLYEEKNSIAMLPKTLKEADGVILAVNVEWLGIGGFMSQFLDACWLYGDKEHISNLYMMPVVISNTVGEKEAQLTLVRAWEILGGIVCDGICGYVEDHVEFETDLDYASIIEKKAEQMYRTVKQKTRFLPGSNMVIKQGIRSSLNLTPQESEQLSVYVSDDSYVKKQKEDLEELTQMFKGLLGDTSAKPSGAEFVDEFTRAFQPIEGEKTSYEIELTDVNRTLVLEIEYGQLDCHYGKKENARVQVKTTKELLQKIVDGRSTFQRAFMAAELTAKGNFHDIKRFDDYFKFQN